MYMHVRGGVIGFEWDEGNLDKNYKKHGIEPKQAEEVFIDSESIILPDVGHSQKEDGHIIVGNTLDKQHLFIIFTFRGSRVRIISARKMHKKEVERYEKLKKNT